MSRPGFSRQARATIKVAERHGYVLVRWKRHLVFRHPCGAQVATAVTPSDKHGLRNFETDLKRNLDKAR